MRDIRLTPKQRLAILQATRTNLARPRGWVKGVFRKTYDDGEIGYCLAGAAKHEAGRLYPDRFTYVDESRLVKALSLDALAQAKLAHDRDRESADKAGSGYVFTFRFNDRSKTRKRDVLALLDEKIAETQAEVAS